MALIDIIEKQQQQTYFIYNARSRYFKSNYCFVVALKCVISRKTNTLGRRRVMRLLAFFFVSLSNQYNDKSLLCWTNHSSRAVKRTIIWQIRRSEGLAAKNYNHWTLAVCNPIKKNHVEMWILFIVRREHQSPRHAEQYRRRYSCMWTYIYKWWNGDTHRPGIICRRQNGT